MQCILRKDPSFRWHLQAELGLSGQEGTDQMLSGNIIDDYEQETKYAGSQVMNFTVGDKLWEVGQELIND